jgi:hypothetical protein
MSIKHVLGILTLLAALAVTHAAFAGDARDPAAPGLGSPGLRGAGDDAGAKAGAVTPAAVAVARLTLASQLAEIGRETGSPFALTAAAELFASADVRNSALKKERTEGGETPAVGSRPADEPATDAKTLFAEAAELADAASNAPLAAQIEERAAAVASSRGTAVGEGGEHRDRVNPYATDVYRVRYRGGELARATARADGRHDIDLYVYNEYGNLIAFDDGLGSIGVCIWTPTSTSDYFLNVKNVTGSQVSYVIYTN